MKALIIGCGSIGCRHLRNLLDLTDRDVEIIAYRQRGDDAEVMKREFGLRTFFNRVEALAERPDFALITNPTSLHVPVAIEAARSGCHLFIEKPLSHSLDSVDKLLDLIRERDLIAFVGFNMRFHRGLQLVKRVLEEERIGRVLSIRAQVGQYLPDWRPGQDYRRSYSARRALGGGVILDLIHELDYVRWLVGEVNQVTCFAGHISSLEIETEDVAEILLHFENGAIGNVHMDCIQRFPSRTCRIVGKEGVITWDYYANEVRLFEADRGDWQVFCQKGFKRNDMYRAEMQHFLACLEGHEKPAVDVEEGARILRLALAARESAETGKICGL